MASEVVVPAEVPTGQYQRVSRPFQNWTLICDKNLKERKKICNVTQAIGDQAGQTVFGWSLTATEKGKLYILLRAPPIVPRNGKLTLIFDGRCYPVHVALEGCSETVCIGMVPVGPILRDQISRATSPQISSPLPQVKQYP